MRREPHLTATRSSHDAVVTLEALTCGYHGRPVFWDVSLTLPAGQVIGLVGPTGSGKTTLLKAILGLVQPWRGRVCLFGRPVGRTTRARLGYVPQVETLDWQFPVTAEQVSSWGRSVAGAGNPGHRPRNERPPGGSCTSSASATAPGGSSASSPEGSSSGCSSPAR
jgi:ABC-type transport system involved in Fe-S cluster assembly fused permease/ATPase subunit